MGVNWRNWRGWRGLDQRTRGLWLCGLILLVGLGSALAVYVAAHNAPEAGYREAYGAIYQGEPLRSKKFVREMEIIGGKANVFFYDLMFWFEGLWQGKRLAATLAVITLFITGLVYYFAVYLGPYQGPDDDHASPGPPPG